MSFNGKKNRLKEIWNKGIIQRFSRITYDVFWNIILFLLIIGLLGAIFAGGVGAGYFASLVKDEKVQSAEQMVTAIYNYEETSKLYFADGIYLADVRADLHREEIELKDVSETLINAVIATEDEYFHEHKGVVPKAIIRAIVQEAFNADMQTGGSTLTQQLIKNQILTNEVSFDRKAKEILLALRLERYFDKEEILEAYLNVIPYGREASGRNIAGIQTAAIGIFGKNANEVNLPQAAFLAGLPQSPFAYTPFQRTGELKKSEGLQPGINRMKTVLKRMYDLNYISKKEYEAAINYDIVGDFIEAKPLSIEKYGYVIDEVQERAHRIIFEKIVEENGYTVEELLEAKNKSGEENSSEKQNLYDHFYTLASRELQTGGYHIHSTIDKEIYDAMQTVVDNYEHYGPDRPVIIEDRETGKKIEKIEPVQVGAMLIENHTGRIISFVGGREYSLENEWNYATKSERPNGSTMKPLLAFSAAMEKGYIQPGTPIADIKITDEFPDPSSPTGYWTPNNYGGSFYGIVPVRRALASSYNVSTAKIYKMIRAENPVEEYLYNRMKMNSLTEIDFSSVGSVSLGQLHKGITVEENTKAFTVFGNEGKFTDAYMIEKITTSDGKVIYEHEPDPVQVYSPVTTYLTVDMMRDVIKSGTATYLNSQIKYKNVDWVGKTGTSNDHKDAWFVGLNPNITFGLWLGYDTPHDLMSSCRGCSLTYSQRANKLWAELINTAADINPDLIAPSERFKRPDGVVEKSICQISGMLPSELCKKVGLVRTDLFNKDFVPTKVDDSLIEGSYVLIDGKAVIAGPKTPKEFIKGNGVTFNPEFLKREGYDKLDDLTDLFPRTDRHLWEKIGLPNTEYGNILEDDGEKPEPPTSLSITNNKLSWKKSTSKDVVGYRIYLATDPKGKFSLLTSTTNTEAKINTTYATIKIKAVDYFGLESDASEEILIGEPPEKEKEKDRDKEENKDKDKDKDKDKGKDKDKKPKPDGKDQEQDDKKNESSDEDDSN